MVVDRRSFNGRSLATTFRVFGALQQSIYRLTGGRVMGKTAGVPVLLLTVTGRRSGKKRTLPLVYWERDGEYIVSASAGGVWLPMWYRNLQADPRVAVRVRRRRFNSKAHLADADEGRALWAVTASLSSKYPSYREKMGEDIPMIVLRPDAPEPTS